MPKHSKRFNEAKKDLVHLKLYPLDEAFERVKKTATAKFDESVDVAVRTGLDQNMQISSCAVAVYYHTELVKLLV